MASNEELAQKIKAGNRDLLPQLWQQIRPFVCQQANRWYMAWRNQRPGLEPDDLIQCGYIAMCEAVEQFKPEQWSFLTRLKYPLLTAFSVEVGCRTPAQLKRPENCAVSLSRPMNDDEDITLQDMIEDPKAMEEMDNAEKSVYDLQAAPIVSQALDSLSERQKTVIHERYYENKTFREVASDVGVSVSMIQQNERYALRVLRKNPELRELHYGDRNLYRGTSLGSWRRTGCSVQELELLRLDMRRKAKYTNI